MRAFVLGLANSMTIWLVIFYLTLAALFAFCGELARAGYWTGAALITFSTTKF